MLVDFSKIPDEVLEDYGIEVYETAKDAFYWVYLDTNTISYNDILDMLENKSVAEYMESDSYMYKFDNKLYRCTEVEFIDELAQLFPDSVVENGLEEVLKDANERSVDTKTSEKANVDFDMLY